MLQLHSFSRQSAYVVCQIPVLLGTVHHNTMTEQVFPEHQPGLGLIKHPFFSVPYPEHKYHQHRFIADVFQLHSSRSLLLGNPGGIHLMKPNDHRKWSIASPVLL